jgi:hypothetical protein
MELIAIPYDALPCSLATFTINGMDADKDDFGDSSDIDSDNAEEYGCGNHVFQGKMPTQAVLDKYKITVDEYSTIVRELESKLDVGSCGWCI